MATSQVSVYSLALDSSAAAVCARLSKPVKSRPRAHLDAHLAVGEEEGQLGDGHQPGVGVQHLVRYVVPLQIPVHRQLVRLALQSCSAGFWHSLFALCTSGGICQTAVSKARCQAAEGRARLAASWRKRRSDFAMVANWLTMHNGIMAIAKKGPRQWDALGQLALPPQCPREAVHDALVHSHADHRALPCPASRLPDQSTKLTLLLRRCWGSDLMVVAGKA